MQAKDNHSGGLAGAALLAVVVALTGLAGAVKIAQSARQPAQRGSNAPWRELIAGSVATFSLWMWRIGTGSPYTGRAILSMQLEGGPASSKTQIPIPETGRAGVSVLYRGTHRFEQEGTYRLDLELPDLPARWAASLPVRPATTWYSSILQSVGAVVLAAGSLVLILAFLVAAGVRGPRRGLSWLRSRRS